MPSSPHKYPQPPRRIVPNPSNLPSALVQPPKTYGRLTRTHSEPRSYHASAVGGGMYHFYVRSDDWIPRRNAQVARMETQTRESKQNTQAAGVEERDDVGFVAAGPRGRGGAVQGADEVRQADVVRRERFCVRVEHEAGSAPGAERQPGALGVRSELHHGRVQRGEQREAKPLQRELPGGRGGPVPGEPVRADAGGRPGAADAGGNLLRHPVLRAGAQDGPRTKLHPHQTEPVAQLYRDYITSAFIKNMPTGSVPYRSSLARVAIASPSFPNDPEEGDPVRSRLFVLRGTVARVTNRLWGGGVRVGVHW
eukprot:CAMPEP_0178995774 /NCGR_PEP_ID=MMETSP0795-20121207/7996_1 /TAXON_ID=88552 /ORGANISM="Amoebophrya sp., Strain Ameob2" /LENGTH=308 /DNA_ID=CAMNT_0020688083 /DNA_START=190 /DNA_END=1112 /DNA_ORIENTATION=-